jgi:MFS family permease
MAAYNQINRIVARSPAVYRARRQRGASHLQGRNREAQLPQTFLLGFGFSASACCGRVCNAFVPIFLSQRFDLAPGIIGFVADAGQYRRTIDPASHRRTIRPVAHTIGRRMPFVLVGAPIAAVAFAFVPMAQALPLFIASIVTVLLAMAVYRTPVIALMPDITPNAFRSQANGVINFMGGIGAIIAFLAASLYEVRPQLAVLGRAAWF